MRSFYQISKWSLVALLILFIGCSHDDDVFTKTPQERKNVQISKLDSLLSSSPAFRGVYFPNDAEYGGSVIYFSFDGEGKVKMSSGFDEDTEITESLYEIEYNSSVELVFSTFNHISKLADNNLPGLQGTGFEGSNNFIFAGEKEKGIVLKDPRNLSKFLLTPISQDKFTASEAKSDAIFENRRYLASPSNSVFQTLEVEDGTDTHSYDFYYDINRLHGSAKQRGEEGAVKDELDFGVAFTEQGLTASPEIEVGDNNFKNFSYNEEDDVFVSTLKNGSTAILGSAREPAYIPDDYKDFIEEGPVNTGYRPYAWGDNELTSQGFKQVIQEVDNNLAESGRTFVYFQFNFAFEPGGNNCDSFLFIDYLSGDTEYLANYCFSVAHVEDKKFFITYNGPANNNGANREEAMMPLIKFFTSDKGLIVTNEGSFTASNASYTNKSATITSVKNPSERVYVLVFP